MRRLLPFRDRPAVEHQVYDLPAREACDRCDALLEGEFDFTHFRVCPVCGRHFGISASRRIAYLVDPDSFEERAADLYSTDPLDFADDEPYIERLAAMQERTGRSDGMICGTATIGGTPVVLAVLDFTFMGGSMGVVVGERLARAAELAAGKKRPLIASVASGGARMQEGMLSLLQMAKTASSIAVLKEEGVPFVSILTDPTTGGVFASFASLADIILAEPEALIGFAGPRVVEQTLGRPLPAGSHSAEFQYAHGMVDAIVARPDQRTWLVRLLTALKEVEGSKPKEVAPEPVIDSKSAWETVQAARSPNRPSTRHYLERIAPGFVELHGDREGPDDPAIVAAIGKLEGIPVGLVGFDRFAASDIAGAAGHPLPLRIVVVEGDVKPVARNRRAAPPPKHEPLGWNGNERVVRHRHVLCRLIVMHQQGALAGVYLICGQPQADPFAQQRFRWCHLRPRHLDRIQRRGVVGGDVVRRQIGKILMQDGSLLLVRLQAVIPEDLAGRESERGRTTHPVRQFEVADGQFQWQVQRDLRGVHPHRAFVEPRPGLFWNGYAHPEHMIGTPFEIDGAGQRN